jgi:hypothetical protein
MKNFNKQFKKGTVPKQPIDPNSPLNQIEPSPLKSRKRDGIALGFQTQARPGLSGVTDQVHGKTAVRSK